MNELSFEILNIIYEYCPDDNYKIIDVNDIILALPSGVNIEENKLFEIIEDLATDGSILLKYKDDEDICLSLSLKGRRIVKKERETREKLEAQRKAKEKAEAERKAREEQERLERIEKEKQLEEAKQALSELKAQKKSKKDQEVQELKQQVEELEKEIIQPVEDGAQDNLETSVAVKAEQIPVISAVQHMDFIPLIRKVGKVAFWGGLTGAIIGNALFFSARYIMDILGI